MNLPNEQFYHHPPIPDPSSPLSRSRKAVSAEAGSRGPGQSRNPSRLGAQVMCVDLIDPGSTWEQ